MDDFHSATLLGLPLSGPDAGWYEAAGGYEIRLLAGGDHGNAEPLDVTIPGGLADGDLERTEGHGNRTLSYLVVVHARTAAGLAQASADLDRVVGRPGEYIWTPPAADGEACVFEVQTSSKGREYPDTWDLQEMGVVEGMPVALYRLTLKALPFVRALEPTVVVGTGNGSDTTVSSPTITTVYNGVGTTYWSGTKGVAAVPSGGVWNGTTDAIHGGVSSLTYSNFLPLAPTPWLRATISGWGGDARPEVGARVGGSGAVILPLVRDGADYYWYLPVTATSVTFIATGRPLGSRLIITQVTRQDELYYGSTAKQLLRTLRVDGTARTAASLRISHETAQLGVTAVYAYRTRGTDYRPFLTEDLLTTEGISPAAVPDAAAAIMGRYLQVTPAISATFSIPAVRLPEGGYTIRARLKAPAAGVRSITWTATTQVAGVNIATETFAARSVTVGTGYAWFDVTPVGGLTLPTLATSATAGATVRLTMTVSAETHLDQGLLCNTDLGSLSMVDAGANRELRINSATPEVPRRSIWLGATAGTVDRHATAAEVASDEEQKWEPGEYMVASISSAVNVAMDATYLRRYHGVVAAPVSA